MSAASNAVFLSYASQDADAARKICDALRGAGVEVWFDQNQLVGGDAWDAKIRGQIASCGLFVPIISVNTQARGEGYFRLEWKLAVDRSHLMAHDQPFLLPVVIDGTADVAARVPTEFRAVQWTRLPGGETSAAFCARVTALLGGPEAVGQAFQSVGAERSNVAHQLRARATHRRRWLLPVFTSVVAIAALAFWQPWKKSPPEPKSSAPPAPSLSTGLTEARQLTLKARALIDDDLMAARESFRLAEELCRRATTLDPSDGEAWATWARVSAELIRIRYDRSTPRRDAFRIQMERALRLAPDSIETKLAMLNNRLSRGDEAETERGLRELLQRAPGDARVVRRAAVIFDDAELARLKRENQALFESDPRLIFREGAGLRREGRLYEAEQLFDRAQAVAPNVESYRAKLYGLLSYGPDLSAAKAYVEKLPASLLLEDAFASNIARLWIRLGEGDKALQALQRVPRDFFEDMQQTLPKGFLEGWALKVANRTTAAEAKWRTALEVVDRRLVTEPNEPTLIRWKAVLQALIGRTTDAVKNWKLFTELAGPSVRHSRAEFELALGNHEEAIRAVEEGLSDLARAERDSLLLGLAAVNELRFDPWFAPIRSDPRVKKLIDDGVIRLKQAWERGAN